MALEQVFFHLYSLVEDVFFKPDFIYHIASFHLETEKFKVYRVNFDGLLLKFMCRWGLLNTCTYTYASIFN